MRQRAVAAAVDTARRHGLRVDEPAVLHDGFDVSFWTFVEADPERAATSADCAAMLVDLHAALDRSPGELPRLVQTALDHRRWLELIGSDTADRSRLVDAVERLEPFLAGAQEDHHALHGDAHAGNLIGTRDGLLWIDFEEVCRGPVEWDLATIGDAGAASLYHKLDPGRLDTCNQLRSLQVALCLMALRDVFADVPG